MVGGPNCAHATAPKLEQEAVLVRDDAPDPHAGTVSRNEGPGNRIQGCTPGFGIAAEANGGNPARRQSRIAAIELGQLESQWVAERIGHPVVKAFNSILAQSLVTRAAQRGAKDRIALPVAGD